MLNLLPPNEKKLLAQERQKRLFIVLCFELIVFLVCIFLVLLAIEFYSLGELASQNFLLQQASAENQSAEFSYFKDAMQGYNNELVLVDSFYKKKKFFGDASNTLLQVQRPAGLYFIRFSMQSQEQSNDIKVVVTGVSDTRENLIIFKNNIEATGKIRNVAFSPASWINQKNITFNLTLDIIDER
ncbi:MAG: hypothetical protein ABIJ84_02855 [bacterium]